MHSIFLRRSLHLWRGQALGVLSFLTGQLGRILFCWSDIGGVCRPFWRTPLLCSVRGTDLVRGGARHIPTSRASRSDKSRIIFFFESPSCDRARQEAGRRTTFPRKTSRSFCCAAEQRIVCGCSGARSAHRVPVPYGHIEKARIRGPDIERLSG